MIAPPIADGARVTKTSVEPGDLHKLGDGGRVLASHGPVEVNGEPVYGYTVEWDDMPDFPVFVSGTKIEEAPW